eukprot:1931761-Rhodomonas_salina.2
MIWRRNVRVDLACGGAERIGLMSRLKDRCSLSLSRSLISQLLSSHSPPSFSRPLTLPRPLPSSLPLFSRSPPTFTRFGSFFCSHQFEEIDEDGSGELSLEEVVQ